MLDEDHREFFNAWQFSLRSKNASCTIKMLSLSYLAIFRSFFFLSLIKFRLICFHDDVWNRSDIKERHSFNFFFFLHEFMSIIFWKFKRLIAWLGLNISLYDETSHLINEFLIFCVILILLMKRIVPKFNKINCMSLYFAV